MIWMFTLVKFPFSVLVQHTLITGNGTHYLTISYCLGQLNITRTSQSTWTVRNIPVRMRLPSGVQSATISIYWAKYCATSATCYRTTLQKFELDLPNLHWWLLISQKHICLWMEMYRNILFMLHVNGIMLPNHTPFQEMLIIVSFLCMAPSTHNTGAITGASKMENILIMYYHTAWYLTIIVSLAIFVHVNKKLS